MPSPLTSPTARGVEPTLPREELFAGPSNSAPLVPFKKLALSVVGVPDQPLVLPNTTSTLPAPVLAGGAPMMMSAMPSPLTSPAATDQPARSPAIPSSSKPLLPLSEDSGSGLGNPL